MTHPGVEYLDAFDRREAERKQADAERVARLERERRAQGKGVVVTPSLFVRGVCQGCGQPTEEHDRGRDEERCTVDFLFRQDAS